MTYLDLLPMPSLSARLVQEQAVHWQGLQSCSQGPGIRQGMLYRRNNTAG